MWSSPARVDQQSAVDAVAVPRLLSEESRRLVVRSNDVEPVVAAHAPARRVVEPLDAAADVARQKCGLVADAERGFIEQRHPADAAGHVRNDGAARRRRHDEVAGVVQQVWRFPVRRRAAELQILRHAERAGHFALDADVPIEMDLDGSAESIVAEARSRRPAAFREERRAARNDRHHDGSGTRHCVLRVRPAGSRQADKSKHHRKKTFHRWPPVASHVPATFARGAGAQQSGRRAIHGSLLRARSMQAQWTKAISSFWTMTMSAVWTDAKCARSRRKVVDNSIEVQTWKTRNVPSPITASCRTRSSRTIPTNCVRR